jgi:AraC-like DNA-binding protein
VAVIYSQLASRISWHSHEQFEILFLAEGATSYEYADGQISELPSGHFLVIPPGVRHRGLLDVRTPVRLLCVMLDPKIKGSFQRTPFTADEFKWIHNQCVDGAMTVCRMGPELRRLTRVLSQLVMSDRTAVQAFNSSVRLNLYATILETAKQLTASRVSEASSTVDLVTRFMQANLKEMLSIDDIAVVATCSRVRLFRIFKESTGLAPNDFLQRLRIKQAQMDLLDTDKSITEIAFNNGFSTSQYFSTVFRKYTGDTPARFRKRRMP